jgi:RNA polymerase sigma-70 factor, ECF subfamily
VPVEDPAGRLVKDPRTPPYNGHMAIREAMVAVLGESAGDDVASALAELYAAGQARWATLAPVPPEEFAAHLALLLPPDADPVAHLRSLVAEDVYLACACARGRADAVAVFDRDFLSRVPGYVRRIDGSPGFVEEVQQQLRERLLVHRPEALPRIAAYSGRGALRSWLRVIAVRVALDHRARPDDAHLDDEAMADQLAAPASAELAVLRTRCAGAMTDALKRAIAALAPEQRVILRLYFASGRSTEQIASVLHVDRSTAARRLVAARKAVFDATHRLLRASIPVETREFASLARTLHEHLDISLNGLLAEPA